MFRAGARMEQGSLLMHYLHYLKNLAFTLLACSCLLLTACFPDTDSPEQQLADVNSWIYTSMDYWYFWTDDLPKKPSIAREPEAFFESLLSDEDRFSFIYPNAGELVDLLNGVTLESGFEFKLYRDSVNTDNLFLQIIYIKKGSPADDLALKRGDVITAINGAVLNSTNYRSLLADMNQPYMGKYQRYNFDQDAWVSQGTFDLTPVRYAENPILLDTIYQIEGKKIGYLVYTFFSPGPAENSNFYDSGVRQVFGEFKQAAITDIIIDLRFNSGGSISSVFNLANLLANASSGDLMLRRSYNERVEDDIKNSEDLGPGYLTTPYTIATNNIGRQLASNTVQFITSNRSASASEVLINVLRPYMSTFIVGDTTVGKDVGSITIEDVDDEDNNWGIQPIVVKLVNANGEDYPEGFIPEVAIKENFLKLKPIGDTEEVLLNAALASIGVQPARVTLPVLQQSTPIFNSIDQQARKGKTLMDLPFQSR